MGDERAPDGGAGTATAGGAAAPTVEAAEPAASTPGRGRGVLIAWLFVLPALVLLGALVVYPIFFSIFRSLFDRAGDTFVGIDNYEEIFSSPTTLTAMRNNVIWVIVAPTVVTILGLIFAVLTERVSWSTAFKVAVFMPMAISFLSAGVTWRLIYEQDPERGLANAASRAVIDVFRGPGGYPGADPRDEGLLRPAGGGFATTATYSAGDQVSFGLIGVAQDLVPEDATDAATPQPGEGEIAGAVWLDFTRGGGGQENVIDQGELGLPGVDVEAVAGSEVVASASTGPDGGFVLEGLEGGSQYALRLAASSFREPFAGFSWLGPTLVTPAIIIAYAWIWAGFAMVVIGAGLAAIPREVLEASRVDGASEWQVFRRVTVPLLAPVLSVVFVTLVINVLKIFDLVLVIAPGSSQADANVVALQMWKTAFGARDFGLGSALAVFLFVLVIPAMIFNLRRFRREG